MVSIRATHKDPETGPLTYEWEVLAETTDRRVEGDKENRPETVPDAVWHSDRPGEGELFAPRALGLHRLFVTVKDGKIGGLAGFETASGPNRR